MNQNFKKNVFLVPDRLNARLLVFVVDTIDVDL